LTIRINHRWPGPFAPPPLQELRHYYGPVRQHIPRRYSLPYGVLPLDRLPITAPDPVRSCRDAPSHVPCENRRPGSCRLHTGHRLANTRAPARLFPQPETRPRFRCHLFCNGTSTAVRFYSSSWSLPDTLYGAFSTSFTTTVFSQCSMWRFGASTRIATPKGQTIISRTASTPVNLSYLHKVSFIVRGTRPGKVGDQQPSLRQAASHVQLIARRVRDEGRARNLYIGIDIQISASAPAAGPRQGR
jgi:hypothetical protein